MPFLTPGKWLLAWINNNMNPNVKRWLISSLITFTTGFLAVFVLDINSITPESFRDGSAAGLLFVAARAGVKAVIEGFLAWRVSK